MTLFLIAIRITTGLIRRESKNLHENVYKNDDHDFKNEPKVALVSDSGLLL